MSGDDYSTTGGLVSEKQIKKQLTDAAVEDGSSGGVSVSESGRCYSYDSELALEARQNTAEAERLLEKAKCILRDFDLRGNICDLNDAIRLLEIAYNVKAGISSNKLGFLGKLCHTLLERFQLMGDLRDVETVIGAVRNATSRASDENENKASCLHALAIALRSRFDRNTQIADIDEAILAAQKAIDLTPDGHPDKMGYLDALGTSLYEKFSRLGNVIDLESAICTQELVVDAVPDKDEDKSGYLCNLGISLHARYESLNDIHDLERAIASHRCAVELCRERNFRTSLYLMNLGNAIHSRYKCSGQLVDIEEAISLLQNAVDLTSERDPQKPGKLSNLGVALESRFDHLGELTDIERAVTVMQVAADLTSDENCSKGAYLLNLGNGLQSRFIRLGDPEDIEKAIGLKQRAIDFVPDGAIRKPLLLTNLCNSFRIRFEAMAKLTDIENAIDNGKLAVELIPKGHNNRPACLSNLGSSLNSRFERLGELSDIKNAILAHREAVELTSDQDSSKPTRLNNLGSSFQSRYHHFGHTSDLDDAIVVVRLAVDLTPDGHVDKALYLMNLGVILSEAGDNEGAEAKSTLDRAIAALQHAVDFLPDSHADKPMYFQNIADALTRRYERFRDIDDIEKAGSAQKQALDLCPDWHADVPSRLHNLSTLLKITFNELGNLQNLEQAILAQHEALRFLPGDDVQKPVYLMHLGNLLMDRFKRLGERPDIDSAIDIQRSADKVIPDDHASKAMGLNNLGRSLLGRFRYFNNLSDLEEAVRVLRRAYELTPDGYPHRAIRLYNYGYVLVNRFDHLKQLPDIETAIFIYREALCLISKGDTSESICLDRLGYALHQRFNSLGNEADLDEAIVLFAKAISETPLGHVTKFHPRFHFGDALQCRYKCFKQRRFRDRRRDLDDAAFAFQLAAEEPANSPTGQLLAAVRWMGICWAVRDTHSFLNASRRLMDLIPQVVWLGQKVHNRFKPLPDIGVAVGLAVSCAITNGDVDNSQAVEWMEEGKSIIWGQIHQLRTPVDELRLKHDNLASELVQIANALENSGSMADIRANDTVKTGISRSSFEDEAQTHREMARKYDEIINRIRELDGFERFLRPRRFEELKATAERGPVILINVTSGLKTSNALVLHRSGSINHIHLADFSYDEASKMRKTLIECLASEGAYRGRGQLRAAGPDRLVRILDKLWSLVVEPIFDSMKELIYSESTIRPHITWLATGPLAFLPLHAAGNYLSTDGHQRKTVYDFVYSSYTPSLSALLVHNAPESASSEDPRILAISQPYASGFSPIPFTNDEIRSIERSARKITLLNEEQASVPAVLDAMNTHSMVHLACHGVQNEEDSLKSAFILSDGRLLLEDIMKKNLESKEFAFLSACQTAAGDEQTPDEAMHLAAGMMAAGYKSVVGTMWSIGDKDASIVVEAFYSKLFEPQGNEEAGRRLKISEALHYAVQRLRDEIGEESFLRWVPFVHFGR